MAQPILVSINEDSAEISFLVSAESPSFSLPDMQIRRASHIIPANACLRAAWRICRVFGDNTPLANFTRLWPCKWLVDFSPIGGDIVPIEWASRQSAIEFEIQWLETNFL
jgi:hypothetical protein